MTDREKIEAYLDHIGELVGTEETLAKEEISKLCGFARAMLDWADQVREQAPTHWWLFSEIERRLAGVLR